MCLRTDALLPLQHSWPGGHKCLSSRQITLCITRQIKLCITRHMPRICTPPCLGNLRNSPHKCPSLCVTSAVHLFGSAILMTPYNLNYLCVTSAGLGQIAAMISGLHLFGSAILMTPYNLLSLCATSAGFGATRCS